MMICIDLKHNTILLPVNMYTICCGLWCTIYDSSFVELLLFLPYIPCVELGSFVFVTKEMEMSIIIVLVYKHVTYVIILQMYAFMLFIHPKIIVMKISTFERILTWLQVRLVKIFNLIIKEFMMEHDDKKDLVAEVRNH